MSVAGSPQDIGEGADGSGGSGERGGAKPVTGQGREGARERGSREAKVCVCVFSMKPLFPSAGIQQIQCWPSVHPREILRTSSDVTNRGGGCSAATV